MNLIQDKLLVVVWNRPNSALLAVGSQNWKPKLAVTKRAIELLGDQVVSPKDATP